MSNRPRTDGNYCTAVRTTRRLRTDDLLARVDAVAVFSTYTTRRQWIEGAADAGVTFG